MPALNQLRNSTNNGANHPAHLFRQFRARLVTLSSERHEVFLRVWCANSHALCSAHWAFVSPRLPGPVKVHRLTATKPVEAANPILPLLVRTLERACSSFGTNETATLTVIKNATCTPAFAPAGNGTYTLQVAGGPAPVVIASDDGFIQCGDDGQGTHYSQCSHAYPSGYGVTLTETPAQGTTAYRVQWSGGCSGTSSSISVAMDTNRSCNVTLTPL